MNDNPAGAAAPASRVAADQRPVRKRLVVFSDGTGNSSAKVVKTNVWRLYQAVDLGPAPPDDDVPQLAFYDDGVGSSSFLPAAVLGGVLGVGLARNVKDAYAFLCRHWRPGDEIYAFGFSRGAFTIRVLTGVVETQGIITQFGDESELQRHVATAWRRFRWGFEPHWPVNVLTRLVRRTRDALLDWRYRRAPPYPGPGPRAPGAAADPANETPDLRGNAPARFAFVGLWDTVDAYGLPVEEMTRAWDQWIWPLSMRDRKPAKCVERAVHALCLDDRRATFHPVLWDERLEPGKADGGHIDTARITQVFFAGVHSNVGGGYPNDRLAYVPLVFMVDRIDRMKQGGGLRLVAAQVAEFREFADLDGALYDSRRGLGGFYRYQPRRFDLLSLLRRQESERSLPRAQAAPQDQIERHGSSFNPDIPMPLIHETALRRIEHGAEGYAPITLPRDYRVVTRRGSLAGEGYVVPVADILGAKGTPVDADPVGRLGYQERLWNWVWLRRIAYFASLFVVFALFMLPFWVTTEATGGDDPAYVSAFAAIPEAIGDLAPNLVSAWFAAYRARPDIAFGLIGALLALLWLGSAAEGAIRDRMQRWWRGDAAPKPDLPVLDGPVYALRTSPLYLGVLNWAKASGLPGLFAFLFAYVGLALAAHGLFALSGSGCAATPTAAPWRLGQTERSGVFDPKNPCAATGIPLQGGRRYRIDIVADAGWADASMPADLFGYDYAGMPRWRAAGWRAFFTAALPLRRHITAPWYVLFARVGADGRDVQPLARSVRPPPGDRAARLTASFEMTPRRNGELFLYLNDAVPFFGLDFYANNKGGAKVTVTRLAWEGGAPEGRD